MVTKAYTDLKLQACLSMYNFCYYQALKGYGPFPHPTSFSIISLKSGLNLALNKNEKGSPIPRCPSKDAALMYYK